MFKNYIKIAFRNFSKNKTWSFINITGLAVGIAGCLLIFLYVQDELSYDRFNKNGNRICRATLEITARGNTRQLLVTPSIVAPLFKRQFPEVVNSVRFYNSTAYGPIAVRYNDQSFYEHHFFYADSTVFDVFTFPLLLGNPKTALSRPRTLVISNSMAKKYFGGQNPLGKIVTLNNSRDFEITGVMADIPHNSHLQFDFLASYTSLTKNWAQSETWDTANLLTYFLLRDTNGSNIIKPKIPALVDRQLGKDLKANGVEIKIQLQPLTRIHLYWSNDIIYIYGYSTLAILILLIACINYMNLATVRSAKRSREVGLRKVLGGFRRQITTQFWVESVIVTFAAIILAFILAELFLPFFNNLSGKHLDIDFIINPFVLLVLLGIGLVVSLVAGSYPALFLSAFKPIDTIKGKQKQTLSGSTLRKILVVFQFAASIILVVSTKVVYDQVQYLKTNKLGFDKEHVVVLRIRDKMLQQNYKSIKNEFLQNPNIVSAAAASNYPGSIFGGYTMAAEGLTRDEYPSAAGYIVEHGIIKTLGLKLVAGHPFPQTWSNKNGYVYIVNETALKALGWSTDDAIGKRINLLGNREGRIIGVVKDFHYLSLREKIQPLAMFIEPGSLDHLLVKISPQDISGTLKFIQQTWKKFAPNTPFEYSFVDQEFDALYRVEERLGKIFASFAGFAILIACLGLFGLASFSTEERTKEIGIRKVVGASVSDILVMLIKNFTLWVVIANCFAWPIAWYIMNKWLQSFAYRINVNLLVFAIAGVLALAIALLTVSWQAIRAAVANPVESLRYE